MQIIDEWDLCALYHKNPYDMLDFHWASPATHTPYELCINGGILGEDGEETTHITTDIRSLKKIGNNIIIVTTNDVEYILGNIRKRYEYESGYSPGQVLEDLIIVYERAGLYYVYD